MMEVQKVACVFTREFTEKYDLTKIKIYEGIFYIKRLMADSVVNLTTLSLYLGDF